MSIATYIERQLSQPDISDRERYNLLHDQAIFTLGLFEGETPHSFRARCALSLSLSSF